MPDQTLAERLVEWSGWRGIEDPEAWADKGQELAREAAALLLPYEQPQPEVAELRRRAYLLRGCDAEIVEANRAELLKDTETHIAALVELAEAQAGERNARDLYDTLSCGLGEHIRAREEAERKAETAWYYMQELGVDPEQDRSEAIEEIKALKEGREKAERALQEVVELVGACNSAGAVDNIESIIREWDTAYEQLAEAEAKLARVAGLLYEWRGLEYAIQLGRRDKTPSQFQCAAELEATLAGEGEESEADHADA